MVAFTDASMSLDGKTGIGEIICDNYLNVDPPDTRAYVGRVTMIEGTLSSTRLEIIAITDVM